MSKVHPSIQRHLSDDEYRRGWFGDGDIPSLDYDDGFVAGWRSAYRVFARTTLLWVVITLGMVALTFAVAWTSHP